METVRDADVRLALHEGPLHDEKKKVSVSGKKHGPLSSDCVSQEPDGTVIAWLP